MVIILMVIKVLIDDKELADDRKYLNKNILIQKLMKLDDNTIRYED